MPKQSSKTGKIRILIADDHSMLIDGLKDIINDRKEFEVIGEAGDGEACVRLARRLCPDIILMDINLPCMSGIVATRMIKKEMPNIKILIVSAYDDDAHIMDSFQAGADGYVPKTYHVTKILESIQALQEKGSYVPEPIVSKLIRNIRDLPQQLVRESVAYSLTPTEIKILDAIKDGKQTKEAATQLKTKEKTIRNHLNSIFLKLGVDNRGKAIDLAIRKGIISRD